MMTIVNKQKKRQARADTTPDTTPDQALGEAAGGMEMTIKGMEPSTINPLNLGAAAQATEEQPPKGGSDSVRQSISQSNLDLELDIDVYTLIFLQIDASWRRRQSSRKQAIALFTLSLATVIFQAITVIAWVDEVMGTDDPRGYWKPAVSKAGIFVSGGTNSEMGGFRTVFGILACLVKLPECQQAFRKVHGMHTRRCQRAWVCVKCERMREGMVKVSRRCPLIPVPLSDSYTTHRRILNHL